MKYNKEELIKVLGIDALDVDTQEQSLGTFLSALELRTGQAVAEKLTDEQLEAFTALVDKDGDEAGEMWLRENIDGYDSIEDEVVELMITEVDDMDVTK